MPAPRHKTSRFRKIHVRVPGGSTHVHYRERNPRLGHCAQCGGTLKGVPRVKATAMKRMPKTQKRPERPYGGMLCSPCMRRHIINTIKR
ncbi:MAG TPA: 50S ribosomal protein L34e [Candidatus Nanoarchaeia archaeon]|nr:50S ribosomal protein L34e [Candidatus Nanoarchaeia archaeon]